MRSLSSSSVWRFLLAATLASCFAASNLHAQNFDYVTDPPHQLAFAAASKPAAFPSPSQCVAAYGLAC